MLDGLANGWTLWTWARPPSGGSCGATQVRAYSTEEQAEAGPHVQTAPMREGSRRAVPGPATKLTMEASPSSPAEERGRPGIS